MQMAAVWGRLVKAKAFPWGHGLFLHDEAFAPSGRTSPVHIPQGVALLCPGLCAHYPFRVFVLSVRCFRACETCLILICLFSFWHDNAYSLTMIFSILVFCISVFVVFPIEDDEASVRGWWCKDRFYLRAGSQGKVGLAPSSGDNHHHPNHFTLTLFVLSVLSVVK